MESSKSKIKLKLESLKKNMQLSIQVKGGKIQEGFFKKFMFKNIQITDIKKQGSYRDTIEDMLRDFKDIPTDQFYLFLTSSEFDQKGDYVKLFSIQIKDVEEIRLIPPNNVEPHIRSLQMQIDELRQVVKTLQQQLIKSRSKSKQSSSHSSLK